MLSNREASDDINLGTRPSHQPEKRARSSSPVKTRRPMQDWASLARSNGSLDSLFSTTSMSHEQLMDFSNSEASHRLHISKADYVIPIPFHIQFPPRLTKSSTTPNLASKSDKSGGSLKFIFTGHSYEPVPAETLSASEVENSAPSPRPSSPVKPPSVITSRKKVSAFVKKTHADHSDQLSMIEEKSMNGSRTSSQKSKDLPSIPTTEPDSLFSTPIDEDTTQTLHDIQGITLPKSEEVVSPSKDKYKSPRTVSSPGRKPPPPDVTTAGEIDNLFGDKHQHESTPVITKKTLSTSRPESFNKRGPDTTTLASNEPSSNFPHQRPAQGIPHTAAFQHNLCVANLPELRLDKRTFSEESQVSSVSSFSSSGDILNFDHAYMSSPNAKGEVRVSKHLTDYMTDRNPKEFKFGGSLQGTGSPGRTESLKDTDSQTFDGFPTLTPENSTKSRSLESEKNVESNSIPAINIDSSENLTPAKSRDSIEQEHELLPESTSETAPLTIPRRASENNLEPVSLDDNFGAGVGFHFPNDTSNATNGSEARRSRTQNMSARRASRRNFFSDGKIEIPDLDDKLFWQKEYSKTTRASEEKQAKSTSKAKSGERSFDSDSDSSFNSQFSKLQTKNAEAKSLPASKSLATISSSVSPVRHSRHRSMYNIEFDYQSVVSPTRNQHSRSRSNAYADTLAESFAHKSGARAARQSGPASYKFGGELKPQSSPISASKNSEENSEIPRIRVSEPPKRVSYAVDFKAEKPVPENSSNFHTRGPSADYYSSFKSSPRSRSALSNPSIQGESDVASSYQSSKSGRGTESTAPTDTDNVMIDLTEEKYDVCMINRNDSTTSYRSTIEKTKDGRNVEVVLVEEDEDEDEVDDRDDLSSIYSRYMNNWGDRNRLQNLPKIAPKMGLGRSLSTQSGTSETSNASGLSWAASSESNFQIKSQASMKREQAYMRTPKTLLANSPSAGLRDKTVAGKKTIKGHQDSSYFDYSENNCYDFKSYMNQQQQVQR